jgi:hypothetical protein
MDALRNFERLACRAERTNDGRKPQRWYGYTLIIISFLPRVSCSSHTKLFDCHHWHPYLAAAYLGLS